MKVKEISSRSNDHIKHVDRLRDDAKARKGEGLVYLEGWRLIKDCPDRFLQEIYLSKQFYDSLNADKQKNLWFNTLPASLTKDIYLLTDEVFNKISDTKTPQGIIALAKYRPCAQKDFYAMCESLTYAPLLFGIEDLADAGNVGMIIRSALGAGADGLIISKASADCLSPKAIRASMSAIFKLHVYISDNFANTVNDLKNLNIKIFAAAAQGSKCYDLCDFKQPSLIVVGSEASGLSQKVLELADCSVNIPLYKELESINAGAAASVLLFEAQRQRKGIK